MQNILLFTLVFSDKKEARMDYVVWHQDIVTAAPTIDLEVFSIPGEGLFMATASYDSRMKSKQQSAIFKWEAERFQVYQSVYTLGAQAWETFHIGHKVYTYYTYYSVFPLV